MTRSPFSPFSRRNFLQTSAGAVALGGASLAFPRIARAETKTLRIASGEADSAAATMDPARNLADPDSARIALAYERLVKLDPEFNPVPELAEGWETNDTGDVWTFRLLRGVKFHDGSEMTANDVVFSYRRLVDPDVGSPAASALSMLPMDGIEALDDYTVRFSLTSPVVTFPEVIATRFTYIAKAGQSDEELRLRGIGTGPYKVESFVPGEDPSVFVRHDGYRREGLPKVDRVEMRSIPDDAARIAALRGGQIDINWDLPRVGIEVLEQDPNVEVIRTRSPFVMTMSMWTDTPPFDDVRVRMAMKLVVDREAMVQLVLGGRGQLGNDNPVAPWVRYAIDTPIRQRDVAEARRLLAEAGHADGLDVELYTSDTVFGFVEMATVYQAMAAEAGINVRITQAPADDYWSAIWLQVPFMCSSWSGRPADDALSVAYLSDAQWNETRWKNADFDEAIAAARRTVDEAERTAHYHRAQELLRDDGGAIISMHPDAMAAMRSNISGWSLHPQQFSKDFSEVEIA